MIGKKINQLATELAPVSTDLTIIGDPISGVSKKITLAQLGAIFSGAVSFYNDLASFPATGDINVIYCAKDTKKLYLWSGSAYVEVFPSQALLDTYQLRSEKGVSNGYASLDSGGKVPISQLPSSIMEYKGMWNAATNTPTLANGTGDTGDVYICNVAGTVNFGAGPITFAVGDYVIYSGTIWQRSSGAVGTVTSVGLSTNGNSITIGSSPVTTSGTISANFVGNSTQYINGAGNLTTFPSLTGFVPYTGATDNVDLGTFDLTADILTAATGSYTSSGGGNTLEISHTSGSGIALNITKGGNGEGLYINKTSGTGNAATIIGTLNATTLVKSGGTSTQFLKADGSVDSSTYLTTSAAATTYLPMVLSSTANSIEINGQFFDVASAANSYTSGRLIIAPTYGAIGYQNAGVFDGLKILTNGNAEFSNSGITRFFNQVRFDSTLTNGTYTYTLPGATGTLALTSDLTGGTVTSVGLSSATSGVTIGSTPITTSGTITLAIATASGSQQGLLSSTDWTTFNNKQSALTNPVTGTGTTNYLPKFTGTSTIGNSLVYDNGTNVGIGVASNLFAKLTVNGGLSIGNGWGTSGATLEASTGAAGTDGATIEVSYWGTSSYGSLFLKTGNAIRATLNASGNLGLGVTPSAWFSTWRAIEIGGADSNVAGNGTGPFRLLRNAYIDAGGTWIYKNTGEASFYQQSTGNHIWYSAPSGTAGNSISFTPLMTLNASGNLSIGNTNDTYKLDVSGTGRFSTAVAIGAGTQALNGDAELTLRDGVAFVGLDFQSARTSGNLGGVRFFNTSSTTDAIAQLLIEVDGKFAFYNDKNATPRLTIASTGAATFSSSVTAQSLITSYSLDGDPVLATFTNANAGTSAEATIYVRNGTTSNDATFIQALGTGFTTTGGFVQDGGVIGTGTALSGGMSLMVRANADMRFYTNGHTNERMRITSGGALLVGTTSDAGQKLQVNGNAILGTTSTGQIRFDNVNSSNVAIELQGGSGSGSVGQSAYLRIGDVTNSRYWVQQINNSYNYAYWFFDGGSWTNVSYLDKTTGAYIALSDKNKKKNFEQSTLGLDAILKLKPTLYNMKNQSENDKKELGFIAQEVKDVIPQAYKQSGDFIGLTEMPIIAALTKAVQELKAELDTLKNK